MPRHGSDAHDYDRDYFDLKMVLVCVRKNVREDEASWALPTAVILLNHEGDTAMIALPLNLTELLEVVQSGNLVKVFMESGFTVS
jgi:hypothetical protein